MVKAYVLRLWLFFFFCLALFPLIVALLCFATFAFPLLIVYYCQ